MRRDRFSSLPVELIIQILALISTKDSVFTTLLSSRWNRLFASVPSLHFDSREINYDDRVRQGWADHINFAKFVNGMLLVHQVPSIESFRLLSYHRSQVSDVLSWIHAAIAREARLIEIITRLTEGECPLPRELFTCQKLVELKLDGNFVLEFIDDVSLPSLKVLAVQLRINDGDSLKRMLSNCPVLTDLTLNRCYEYDKNIVVFSVNVPSLKRFTLLCSFGGWEWELNLPNLEYINCECRNRIYSVSDFKSLDTAKITLFDRIRNGDDDRIWRIASKLEDVRVLSLSKHPLQSLASSPLSMPFPMLHKVTTLEVQVNSLQGWTFLQTTILERSPSLELLVVDEDWMLDLNELSVRFNKMILKYVPLCFSQSLKEVRLCKFRATKVEYEWVRVVLKNCKFLEKLTLTVRYLSPNEEYSAYLERLHQTKKKLLALPRGS